MESERTNDERQYLPTYNSFWAIQPWPELIDTSRIEEEGGHWIRLNNGRIIEYFVCGSEKPDATVLVDCHGGNCTGKLFCTFPDWVTKCKELNVRVISLSQPGFGYSSIEPGRKIKDWPKTDLLPVLEKENVKEFIVTGISFGTPHALATAWHFGKNDSKSHDSSNPPVRCKAVGLRVPYLGSESTDSLGLKQYTNLGYTSESANTSLIGHYTARIMTSMMSKPSAMFETPGFATKLFMEVFSPGVLRNVERIKRDYPEMVKFAMEGFDRSVVHTDQGILYNYATETLVHHGFDVQEIPKDIPMLVWYAEDDEDCPPSHGEWLASKNYFTKVQSRVLKGYGHIGGAFIEHPEFLESMLKLADQD